MTMIEIDDRPPEGWSEPDHRGIVRFTTYERVTRQQAPERPGYEAFFIAVHGDRYTTWAYRPKEKEGT